MDRQFWPRLETFGTPFPTFPPGRPTPKVRTVPRLRGSGAQGPCGHFPKAPAFVGQESSEGVIDIDDEGVIMTWKAPPSTGKKAGTSDHFAREAANFGPQRDPSHLADSRAWGNLCAGLLANIFLHECHLIVNASTALFVWVKTMKSKDCRCSPAKKEALKDHNQLQRLRFRSHCSPMGPWPPLKAVPRAAP